MYISEEDIPVNTVAEEVATGTMVIELKTFDALDLQYKTVLADAFRGRASFDPRAGTKLSNRQIEALQTIGVETNSNLHYEYGLITTRYLDQVPDLRLLKAHIDRRAFELAQDKVFLGLVDKYLALWNEMHEHIATMPGDQLMMYVHTCYHALSELGTMVFPPGFMKLLRDTTVFAEQTANLVGTYVLALIKEFIVSFLIERPDNLEPLDAQDFLIDQTPVEDLFYTQDPEPIVVNYPSVRSTRKYNIEHDLSTKAELSTKLYRRLQHKLPNMSDEDKIVAKAYVRRLRPSLKALKTSYLRRGDSVAVVNKLVTAENYPYLQGVWITRRQQEALLATIDGNTSDYDAFINNGFR